MKKALLFIIANIAFRGYTQQHNKLIADSTGHLAYGWTCHTYQYYQLPFTPFYILDPKKWRSYKAANIHNIIIGPLSSALKIKHK